MNSEQRPSDNRNDHMINSSNDPESSSDAGPSTRKRQAPSDADEQEMSDGENVHSSFHSTDYHPLRTKVYQCSNINRDFNINENSGWMVNDLNVSNSLKHFGQNSLLLHDKGDALSDMRLLSLDHIYTFGHDIDNSVTRYFGHDQHAEVMDDIVVQPFELFPMVAPAVTESCIQASTLHQGIGWMKVMEAAANIIDKTKTGNMETVLSGCAIYKTITTLGGVTSTSNTEDTFIHNCLHNLLAPIFSCDKYFLQEWANKSLQSTQVYQPDWCASVKFWKDRHDLIIAEAKPKGRQHRGIISDKVKLGRELKSMLEELIKTGTEDPEVFGLLVKGEVLEMYAMDLKDDGVYRMVLIESVNLVTNFSEIIHLNRTLPLLYRVKERALAVAKRLEIVELDKSRGITVKPTLPTAWFRQSMDPKMKTL